MSSYLEILTDAMVGKVVGSVISMLKDAYGVCGWVQMLRDAYG